MPSLTITTPPSLARSPPFTVAAGRREVLWRRLDTEWCQREQVEWWAGSEELCSGLRRQMEEEIRRSTEAPCWKNEKGGEDTQRI